MRTKNTWALLLFLNLSWAPTIWGGTIYSTLPSPALPDEFSLGFQDSAINEFGDVIHVSAPSSTNLQSATVALSNWAFESNFEPIGRSAGYLLPITLNLYDLGPTDSLGPRFYSITTTAFIPWRPEPDPRHCGTGSTDYLASDGACYPGALLTATFQLNGVSAPNTFIYGITFNTESYGYDPTGVPGPYDALHLAMSGDPPAVGSNPFPDIVFWNTSIAANYHDGGIGGVDIFRPDAGWAPFSPAIAFSDTPEPSTGSLIAWLVFGYCAIRIRPALKGRVRDLRRKRVS